jgi:hypothetical protein
VESIVTVLEGRGLQLDADTRRRLAACRDPEQLKAWLLAAVRVDAVEQLFDGDACP